MIRIIAGGKTNAYWIKEACYELEKRLVKPFDIKWEFYEEEKLIKKIETEKFSPEDYIVVLDERGKMMKSEEFSKILEAKFIESKRVVFLIGGAYGFNEKIRDSADLVLSFSPMVFPHMIARLMLTEQIYRAQEISRGGKYHHA